MKLNQEVWGKVGVCGREQMIRIKWKLFYGKYVLFNKTSYLNVGSFCKNPGLTFCKKK